MFAWYGVFIIIKIGRVFSNSKFANQVKENIPPKIRIAIPVYADNEKLHDEITRVDGSFDQAISGILNLIERNIDIEIRIVVLKTELQISWKSCKIYCKRNTRGKNGKYNGTRNDGKCI